MAIALPWYAKISAKIVLSRLPIPYSFWRSIGLFRNGSMDQIDYPISIFSKHAKKAFGSIDMRHKTVLELGSGDSIASAVIAASAGAEKVYMVDVGFFATKDIHFYLRLTEELSKHEGFSPIAVKADMTFEQLLEACNAEYLTDGINSLKSIPSETVDFVWSHSCLEHVRKDQFDQTIQEIHRILKSNGSASHNIDLKDHLGGKLNNLRFSHDVWESDFMVNSGFYTNRLRASDFERSFTACGFQIEKWNEGQWESIPTSRKVMSKPFCDLDDRDLLVRTIATKLKKAA